MLLFTDVVDDTDDGLLSNNCTGKDLEVEEEEEEEEVYLFGGEEDNTDEPIPRPLKLFPVEDDGLAPTPPPR